MMKFRKSHSSAFDSPAGILGKQIVKERLALHCLHDEYLFLRQICYGPGHCKQRRLLRPLPKALLQGKYILTPIIRVKAKIQAEIFFDAGAAIDDSRIIS